MLGIGLGVNAIQQGRLVDDGGAGLPAGAIAYADLAAGTFHNTLGGETLADFLIEDATNWGAFDPSQIVDGSGLPNDQSPVLAPNIVDYIAANGVTFVVHFTLANGGAPPSGIVLFDVTDFPDYSAEYAFSLGTDVGEMWIAAGGAHHNLTPLTLGEHKSAFVFNLSGDIAISSDGGSASTQANEAGAPPSAINAVGIECALSGAGTFIHDIAFYPPRSNAEIQALSA
jgi:hypothetical protein